MSDWTSRAIDSIGPVLEAASALLPRLLGAALLLVIGWLIAGLAKRVTQRLLRGAARIAERVPGPKLGRDGKIGGTVRRVLAEIVFWAVVILFAALAAGVLGLDVIDRSAEAIVTYLPSFVTGVAIILAGIVVGGVVHPVVSHSAGTAGIPQHELLGRVAQTAIIATTAVVGATELGLDVSFLANIALLLIGAAVGAFALGLALGTPMHVSNVISGQQVQRLYRKGDRIEIEGISGTIERISQTHVILETDTGEIAVPARWFAEKPSTKLMEGDDGPR